MQTLRDTPRAKSSLRRAARLRTLVGLVTLASCALREGADQPAPPSSVAPVSEPAPSLGRIGQALAGQDGDYTVIMANTVLNSYGQLGVSVVPGANTITVTNIADLNNPVNGSPLKKGDLVMLYQPQGAAIDTNDDPKLYGNVTALNGAGYYEVVVVDSIAGNIITVGNCGGIKNDYRVPAGGQAIRIPQFANLTVQAGASVVAKAWDGKLGGVVALHVQGKLTIAGAIDATAQGFRGGKTDALSNVSGSAKVTTMRTTDAMLGAEKGESIVGSQDDYQTNSMGKYGRGAVANGGGGGNAHNAGGGGGGGGGDPTLTWTGQGVMDLLAVGAGMGWPLEQAYKDNGNKPTTSVGGGRGGHSFSRPAAGVFTDPTVDGPTLTKWGGDNRQDVGGFGGRPLSPNLGFQVFLGGGGGAGDQDNNSGGYGGNGGGLVFVVAGSVVVPGPGTGTITANGGDGGDTGNSHNDGAGGGGGGGTIFMLTAAPLATDLRLTANGGYGGRQTREPTDSAEADGPGGGGSGGLIAYVTGGIPTTSVKGGPGGTSVASTMLKFPVNGATKGSDGRVVTLPRQPQVSGLPSYYPLCVPSDIEVKLTAPTTPVPPGQLADFTVTVTNKGENVANAAEITTTLPAGVATTDVTWMCSGMAGAVCPNGTTSGQGVLPQLVDLPVGGTLTFTMRAKVPSMSPSPTLNLSVTAQPPPGYIDLIPTNNTGSAMVPIQGAVVTIPKSDLEITLSKQPDSPPPGTETTITSTVKNNGPDPAQRPAVILSIPPGSAVTQPPPPPGDTTAPWSCNNEGLTYTCVLKTDLPSGQTAPPIVVKFNTPIDVPGMPTPQVVGMVSSMGSTDPSPSNNTATVDVGAKKVTPTADLALTVSKNPTTAGAGTETTFTLQVQNLGPQTSGPTSVSFTMPPGSLITQGATGNGWACALAVSSYTCLSGPLAMGQAPAIVVKLIAPVAANPGSVVGVVKSPATNDPNLGNNTDSQSIAAGQPTTNADLTVRVTADIVSPKPGDTVTYTGTASNRGPDTVQNPAVIFNLPPGVVVTQPAQGDGWSCVQDGNTAICTRGPLAKGDAPPITVKVRYPSVDITSGTPDVSLVVDAPNNQDPVPGNNTAVVDKRPTSPTSKTDLALTINKSPITAGAGSEVTYTLQASNKGPAASQFPSVTFSVPGGSTITQPATGMTWSCLQNGYAFTCYFNSTLQPGDAPPITIKVNTPVPAMAGKDPGVVAGVVSSPSTEDTDLTNNYAAVDVGINPKTNSDLQVRITTDRPAPNPGDEVTYTVEAKNGGPDPVLNPVVTIVTPPGSELIDGPSGSGWSCARDANVFLCTRDSVGSGMTAPDLTLKVKLPKTDGNAVPVTRATIGASNNDDPVAKNNIASSQAFRLTGGGFACSTTGPAGSSHHDSRTPILLALGLLLSLSSLRRRRAA